MRLAIVGAGAIGAYLGAKLSASGQDVSLIARGPHLREMQSNGIRVCSPEGDFSAHPLATDDFNKVGPVDFIFLTVKAHALTEVSTKLGPLFDSNTAVISAQNGVPWWYFHLHGGIWEGTRLESVDPGGVISNTIPPESIVACIVYPSTSIVAPGVIQHVEGNRFSIGELNGATSDRCKQLSTILTKAGLKSPIRSRIRDELWTKLLGNLAFNPISALTRATLSEIVTNTDTRTLVQAIMKEADAVATRLGVKIPITIERRIEAAGQVGKHKTSMLQDIEKKKPIELESLVGAVVELGEMLNIPMPYTKMIYACTKLLAQSQTERE